MVEVGEFVVKKRKPGLGSMCQIRVFLWGVNGWMCAVAASVGFAGRAFAAVLNSMSEIPTF